ncbi:1154_t:CDS:2 [Funneliformis geosporum]|uniref:1154_t:CDS:1 n=1 Tax=Funneliformis geosporum TaxID=1117311 RepID=A0A9W4SQW7_9GLOM|nr:1154_t:CDS:2 [Funneliformis geosporum]
MLTISAAILFVSEKLGNFWCRLFLREMKKLLKGIKPLKITLNLFEKIHIQKDRIEIDDIMKVCVGN